MKERSLGTLSRGDVAVRTVALPARMEGPAESRKKILATWVLVAMVGLSLLMLAGADRARASTTFTVTNTADPGNCNASGCTLREAIDDANDTPGKDAIHFHIQGGGVQTIKPKSVLPTIKDTVTKDGYTQTGASKNALTQGTNAVLKIEISGEDAEPTTSEFFIQASNNVVKGWRSTASAASASRLAAPLPTL